MVKNNVLTVLWSLSSNYYENKHDISMYIKREKQWDKNACKKYGPSY